MLKGCTWIYSLVWQWLTPAYPGGTGSSPILVPLPCYRTLAWDTGRRWLLRSWREGSEARMTWNRGQKAAINGCGVQEADTLTRTLTCRLVKW